MTLRYPLADHSAATGFGGTALDRSSERRDDRAFIASQRADPLARALLFAASDIVMDGTSLTFGRAAAEALGADWEAAIFLGASDGAPLFAATVPSAPSPLTSHHLRALAVAGGAPQHLLGAAAGARSVLAWHASHGFCANCGTATVPGMAGFRRDCGHCGAHHFPRTDPVVIMLAVDGERCLLGRQKRFATGVYSCLAGFMEPGETIEAAVRREIWEEAGIRTDRVAYHASQPWPFPSSLMIGCFAEATSFDIAPRDTELEDVRWFSRADVVAMVASTHPTHGAPPPVAIAHHLLMAYAEHGAPAADDAMEAGAAAIVAATG